MLHVLGVELNFDITAPDDLDRYLRACERLEEVGKALPPMPEAGVGADWTRAYRDWVRANCKAVTDFIDDVFGEGTANRLLGPKTSLSRILDVYDAIQAAAGEQAQRILRHTLEFAPNRATREEPGGQKP